MAGHVDVSIRVRPSAREDPGELFARFRAWLVACAVSAREARLWLVIQFAVLHAVIWTFILIKLKAAQDVHMDVAEAFAWGQKFQLGYGKHPPLSGWVAGSGSWCSRRRTGRPMRWRWRPRLRPGDLLAASRCASSTARRAFFVVVMLALYPIFNFKGFKYNPDLLQLVTLPLSCSPISTRSRNGAGDPAFGSGLPARWR